VKNVTAEKTKDESRRKFLKYGAGAAVVAAAAAAGYYGLQAPQPAQVTTTTQQVTTEGPATVITTAAKTKAPETIKIGHSSGVTGYLSAAEQICSFWYNLWLEQVNAKGGIYVKEYGQKLPVSLIIYNDRGETDTAARMFERLITVDNVHALWGSYGTFMSFALQPIVNKYKVPCIASNAAPIVIDNPNEYERIYKEGDYFRNKEGQPWYEWNYMLWNEMSYYHEMEALYKALLNAGVKKVAIWEIETLFGVENRREFQHFVDKYGGLEIVTHKTYPFGITDFGSIITDAQNKNPDAVVQFSYPGDSWVSTQQMIERNYNPKLFYNALGMAYEEAYRRFGVNNDGICSHGAGFAAKGKTKGPYGTGGDLLKLYKSRYNEVPDFVDGAIAFATMELLEQAIERAGTLDRQAIYKEMLKAKDNPIPTIIGPVGWDRGPWNEKREGTILQSQNLASPNPPESGFDQEIISSANGSVAKLPGLVEVDLKTADLVYPKPSWRKQ